MNKENPKIFLSYVHEDIGLAKRLYHDLKRHGLDVWFDNESLLPGQEWKKETTKAIRECDYFIGLLSNKCFSKRGFAHSELKLCYKILEQYFPLDSGIFILPVRADKCKPSDGDNRLGRFRWIDIFPESKYQNGLKMILQVILGGTYLLRGKPKELSEYDVRQMIKRHDFYDITRNKLSQGFFHKYKESCIKGDKVVFDEFSSLMWQQSGSSISMIFRAANQWIKELNQNEFAGFSDWRLPTAEEAMSLMEPEKKKNVHINPIFNSTQTMIWTCDPVQGAVERWWVVTFSYGHCDFYYYVDYFPYVRAVRFGQSDKPD